MKLIFSFKNKEASLEANVEGLVEKSLDQKAKNPAKRTRHHIKQEENRKNKELGHKQFMQGMLIFMGIGVFLLIIGIIGMVFGI